MPKHTVSWIIVLVMGANLLRAEPVELSSAIDHVTVYPEWAYVTRKAEVDLPGGQVSLILPKLPPWADGESLRVRVDTDQQCLITGVATRTVYLQQLTEGEVRKGQEAVTALRDKIEDVETKISVLAREEKYLNELGVWSLQKIPHDSATRKVDVEELDNTRKFITEKLLANVSAVNQAKRELRELQKQLDIREKEWNVLKSRAQLERKEIEINLESEKKGKAILFVSYLISGASWFPAYDARTTADKQNVQFACKAVVQQSTGEDWSDATFTLSTVQPYATREKPDLKPWYVNAGTAGQQRAQISLNPRLFSSGASKMSALQQKQFLFNEVNLDAQIAYDNVKRNVEQALEVVRQVEERGTTVELSVPGTFTVKTDGNPVDMAVDETELTATLLYTAVPAISRSTYVIGEMRNTGTFPFLPGPVKVYIDGSLIGRSSIDCVAEGERFELYLGLEERLKVTRELDSKNSSSSLFGDRKRLNVGYNIEVKSFLERPAAIAVNDQIPVSQDKETKVKLINARPRDYGVEKGILTWKLTLPVGGSADISFEFQVEYPAEAALGNAAELVRQIDYAQ